MASIRFLRAMLYLSAEYLYVLYDFYMQHEFYEKLVIEECDVEETEVTASAGNTKKLFKYVSP